VWIDRFAAVVNERAKAQARESKKSKGKGSGRRLI
jgi:hypothetical protein